MKPIKPTEFTAKAMITLNGKQVEISGGGKIDQDAGSIFGKYKTKGIPAEIDKRIFKTVLVTGYPSVCADASIHKSPFLFGNYAYARSIDFGSHGYLKYTAVCKFRNGESPDDIVLDSWFEGEGEIEPEMLSDCIEIVETWSPKEREIHGSFDVVFAKRNGTGVMSGKATTVYDLSECSRTLSVPRHRRIVFPKFTDLEDGFELVQTSCLID